MAGGLDWLLNLDSIAARPGDGLNPKLAELLKARRQTLPEDVAVLPTSYASSGLANQTYSRTDLTAAGIPVIGMAEPSRPQAASEPAAEPGRQQRPDQNQNTMEEKQ